MNYYEINDDVNACSGLLTATVASRIHRAAQPALLYLVPFTLLPLLTMAYLKVHRRDETNLSSHLLATDKSSALAVFARVSSLLKKLNPRVKEMQKGHFTVHQKERDKYYCWMLQFSTVRRFLFST